MALQRRPRAVHGRGAGGSVKTTPEDRAAYYNETFPERPPLAANADWVTGTWCIGACYKNPNPLYGAYPRGYLERVHSMFPDAEKVLHVFSGGLKQRDAWLAATLFNGCHDTQVDLVDCMGPEDGRYPTWQGPVEYLPSVWAGRFDLVLADPPYSAADAVKYDVKMPKITNVMRELRRVTAKAGNLVWLDQKWPQHRKTDWKTWGHIGLVRSTNHRMRLVTMFKAV